MSEFLDEESLLTKQELLVEAEHNKKRNNYLRYQLKLKMLTLNWVVGKKKNNRNNKLGINLTELSRSTFRHIISLIICTTLVCLSLQCPSITFHEAHLQ